MTPAYATLLQKCNPAYGFGLESVLHTASGTVTGGSIRAMDKAILLTKIQANLHDRFGIEVSRLAETSRMRDLGMDSMHVLEIMLDLETDLGIKLGDLSLPPNPSLSEVVDVIAQNVP